MGTFIGLIGVLLMGIGEGIYGLFLITHKYLTKFTEYLFQVVLSGE
jgi:hypothetical protein